MNETVKTIIDALKPLAEKLGEGAQHLYEVYVKQAYVVGWMDIAGAVFGLAFVAVALVLFKMARVRFKSTDTEDAAIGLSIAGVFLALIGTLVVVGCSVDAIGHLVNPEYYALQDILNTVKQK